MAAAMMNSNGSPQSMMFATLTELDDEGKKRTKESTDIVSAQWRDVRAASPQRALLPRA